MKKFTQLIAGIVVGLVLAGSVSAQPTNTINIPGVGPVVLVNPAQLKFKGPKKMFAAPPGQTVTVPKPPATFDHSKGGTIKYPILGNDRLGDCYYAATAHGSQTYTGNSGTECTFDVNQLTRRYLQLAGGDRGLYDQLIMPEWKKGIVGPNGPRKIVDEMVVDIGDEFNCQLAAWAFGGLIWTTNLEEGWTQNARPGAVWDAGEGRGVGGHAMFLTGKTERGNWQTQTWAIGPPYIEVTPRAIKESSSEFIVAFSLDQFKPDGTSAFTGLHYDDMAALWTSLGGNPLPPSPFPPPKPPEPAGSHNLRVYVIVGVVLAILIVLIVAMVLDIRKWRAAK